MAAVDVGGRIGIKNCVVISRCIMGRRTNTAVWLPNQNRWQIKVQKDGVRKTFTSAKPGRTGQREANRKADLWLDEESRALACW